MFGNRFHLFCVKFRKDTFLFIRFLLPFNMQIVKEKIFSFLVLILIKIVIVSTIDASRCTYYNNKLVFECNENSDAMECENFWGYSIDEIEFSQNCKISELPSLESFYYLYAREVNITGLGLKKLDARFFTILRTNLNYLWAKNNELKELPEAIFGSNKIEKIDFSHNYFTEIESIGRSGVLHLQELDLSSNNITHIKPDSFLNLTELKRLDLSGNCLTVLETSIFNNLKHLQHLDLSINKISMINENTFLDVDELITINLSMNALNVLENPIFDHINKLGTLDISRNNLSHIEFGIFSHIYISYLNISENNFHKIELSHLIPLSIFALNIAANDIDEITGSLSYAFPYLSKLDLRKNNFNCSHLKTILDNIENVQIKLVLDSSSKLISRKSYRGIACQPIEIELKSSETRQKTNIASEQGTESNSMALASETKMLERMRLLLSERKNSSNERDHDAMKTNNALLIVLIVILLVTVIGMLLYVNHKHLRVHFQRSSAISVRKSDLIDVDSDSVL